MVKTQLEQLARSRPTPDDWFVHNFKDASHPVAIPLPAGRACGFAEDMRHLVGQVRRDLAHLSKASSFAGSRSRRIEASRSTATSSCKS